MRSGRRIIERTFVLALLAAVTGVSQRAAADYCGGALTVPMLAGQHENVGTVTVWNTATTLYVTYETTSGWVITETHLAVAESLAGIPQTRKENPIPGHFPLAASYDEGVSSQTFSIDLCESGFEPGDLLYIASHAVVRNDGGQTETAWADGQEFPGKNWATYFSYTLQGCVCVELPTTPVNMSVVRPGEPWPVTSYFTTTLSGVPEGFSVTNGAYVGWCAQRYVHIPQQIEHSVTLYSSYDPDLPDELQNLHWDEYNYLLNHRGGATWRQLQEALWYVLHRQYYPDDPVAQALVEDALANGEGFFPGPGQVFAVILAPFEDLQLTIIQLPNECPECPEGAGGELVGDANGDCKVNALDLIFVRNRQGMSVDSGDNKAADVNNDNVINVLDLLLVRNELGSLCDRAN